MPRLIDVNTRRGDVAAAVNEILAEGGIPALTIRAIAERVRLSPSALHTCYGSRERLLRIVAWDTGRARRRHIELEAQHDGITAFLPTDDEDLVALRAWLGWIELGRSADWLTSTIDEAIESELHLIARIVAYRLARPELDWMQALIDGLSVAMCRPTTPMSRERARVLLQDAARQLLPEEAPPAPSPLTAPAPRRRTDDD